MRIYDANIMLGVACYHATDQKIERLSWDDVSLYAAHFSVANSINQTSSLRISREDIIRFCDKNSKYVYYDRNAEEMVFKGLERDDVHHFYWNYGMLSNYYYGEAAIEKANEALEKALRKESLAAI